MASGVRGSCKDVLDIGTKMCKNMKIGVRMQQYKKCVMISQENRPKRWARTDLKGPCIQG